MDRHQQVLHRPRAERRGRRQVRHLIDPTKCKGCAECVDACGDHDALVMLKKDDPTLKRYQRTWNFYTKMPETPKKFINYKMLVDMMLAERSLLYVGGAGSCMGCGEGTAL